MEEELKDDIVEQPQVKTFTEDEVSRMIQVEADRRVEQAIQTHKNKWLEEYERKAKLTVEEKAKEEYSEKLRELEQRETQLYIKSNSDYAKAELTKIGIDNVEDILPLIVSVDTEKTRDAVAKLVGTFNKTKETVESKYKNDLADIKAPKSGDSKLITKEDFVKMTYSQKLELKQNSPKLYNDFIK